MRFWMESTRRLVATEEDQEHLNFPEDSKSTRRLRRVRKRRHQKAKTTFGHTISKKSTDCVPHTEKVSRWWDKDMVSVRETEWKTLDLNAAIRRKFHVRHSSSCRSCWYRLHGEFAFYQGISPRKSLRQLFQVTRSWSLTELKLLALQTIDWQQLVWRERETTLLTDKAVQFANRRNLRFFWLSAMSGTHQSRTS